MTTFAPDSEAWLASIAWASKAQKAPSEPFTLVRVLATEANGDVRVRTSTDLEMCVPPAALSAKNERAEPDNGMRTTHAALQPAGLMLRAPRQCC